VAAECDSAMRRKKGAAAGSSKSKQNVDDIRRYSSRFLERSFSATQSDAFTASNPTELVGASAFSRLTGVLHP
jgi:hypothetical protein